MSTSNAGNGRSVSRQGMILASEKQRINRAAAKRLEQATGGRLTFVGDRIVRCG